MIKIIVFSFDRAMQLQALLESFFRNFKFAKYNISVIFNTSSSKHDESYSILQERYNSYPLFWYKRKKNNSIPFKLFNRIDNIIRYIRYEYLRNRTDFKEILETLLKASSEKYLMFITDDSYFFRSSSIFFAFC